MKSPCWTAEEVAVLEANKQLTTSEMTALLPHRSFSAIGNQRKVRGLGRTGGTKRKFWTEEHYEFMRSNPHLTDAEMARALGVRLGSLSQARKKADIRKVYRCAKCGVVLGSQGKWCKDHNTAARRWTQYANKATARGFEFTLTHDDLHDLLDRPCAYCGGKGGGIDRIDSSKGYMIGNVNPCCWSCNQMKNDLPMGEWIAQMKRIIQHIEAMQ